MKKIQVMIIDDSATVRQVLTQILGTDPQIEVIATAIDPIVAASKLLTIKPDVIILDIEMPRMDGLTFLKKLMAQHPLPVIICSTLAQAGSDSAITAMRYGAVDVICKPAVGTRQFFEESRIQICDVVKAAVSAKIRQIPDRADIATKYSTDVVLAARKPQNISFRTTEKIVVIGASTGGTEALRVVLEHLPADCPGVVIVQHMPEKFTLAFANHLNETFPHTIREAKDNDPVLRGHILIAPGGKHLLLERSADRYYVTVKEGELVNRHRPSIDVMFRSAAQNAGKNAIAAILTGMGDDGAKGLLELKEAGAKTIAQDEKSCIVFGMPKEAIKLGAADHIVSLELIAQKIMSLV